MKACLSREGTGRGADSASIQGQGKRLGECLSGPRGHWEGGGELCEGAGLGAMGGFGKHTGAGLGARRGPLGAERALGGGA